MRHLIHSLGLALVIAFAAWCVFALRADLARMSFVPVLHSWSVVLLATLFSLANYFLRIVRWKWYLGRLGHSVAPGFAALTYVAGFAFTLSPGKVGEMARARYYMDAGIPLPDVGAAFCVERLMDLLAMLVLSTLILTAFPHYGGAIWSAAALIAITLALLTVLPWRAIARTVKSSPRLPHVVARVTAGVASALATSRSLLRPDVVLPGFLIGLAAWGLEGLGLYVLGSMSAPAHLGPSIGVGIYAVAVLAGALSFLPGGLGSTEAVMATLLAAQGCPIAAALLITIVCRLLTLWLAVCLGWGAVVALRHRLITADLPWQ